MRKIDRLKKDINEAIIESEEYQQYQSARKALAKRPDLTRELNEYRLRMFELQNSDSVGDVLDANDALQEQYKNILSNHEVSRFISAEVQLSMLIKDMFKSILDNLDFDLSFLEY